MRREQVVEVLRAALVIAEALLDPRSSRKLASLAAGSVELPGDTARLG